MTTATRNKLRMYCYPVLFTFSSSAAMAAGGLSILPDQIITESTLIPLGIFVVGVGVVSTAAWKVATTVTRVLIRLEQVEERMNKLEREINNLQR